MRIVALLLSVFVLASCKNETAKNSTVVNEDLEQKIAAIPLDNAKLASGSLHRIDNFPSELIKERPVDVWLPEHYSDDKKFAVLYMHDGQMLFDSTSTWNKQEWKVDEWASRLMNEGHTKDFIVVAVHNISEIRHNDYLPKQPITDNLEAVKAHLERIDYDFDLTKLYSDDYLKFLVQELKPYIDSNYSVYTDKDNTSIMGSSMGGLISMYAISEYPNIFGSAACLSTHWIGTFTNQDNPIPSFFMSYMDENLPDSKTNRMYFDYGTKTLDSLYLPYQEDISSVLNKHGFTINKAFEGTDHSENSWNKRLDEPLTFLLAPQN